MTVKMTGDELQFFSGLAGGFWNPMSAYPANVL